MENQKLDISWETIAKFLTAGLCLYALFLARHIVIWFFFSLVISILLAPSVNFLVRLRIPRFLAVVFIYVGIPGLLGLMIYATAPIFIFEISQLGQNIPDYFEKINPLLKGIGFEVAKNFEDFTAVLVGGLKESSVGVIQALGVFFGGIYSAAMIFTLSFFLSLEKRGMQNILMILTPKKYESSVIMFFDRAQAKVSGWFGARVLACIVVGVVSFIIFFIFDVRYAFILGLISGALNFIPYIGPTVTLILVVLFVGATNSWLAALYIFIALIIIQELEGKLLTPVLMKRFMDMPPVLVLLSLLVGHTIFGFLGMVFSVPVFGIVYEFSREFLEKKRSEESLDM